MEPRYMIKEPGAVEPWSHGLRDMKKMYVMISIKKTNQEPRSHGAKINDQGTRSRGAMVPR